jgi:16S rRNA processing protein RimM
VDRVCVGVVVGAHGVRGGLRVKPFTEDPAAIAAYGPVEDETGGRRFRLKVTGQAKGVVTVAAQGIADRDAAEALKGVKLYVARSRLPQPEEDEFYYSDLIGLRADLEDGTALGTVKGVFDFGAGDVIELALADGRSELLPFTRAVVPVVDVTAGRLVVVPPDVVKARGAEGESDE